ncbi:TetR/AcrR family transcriptional regulator [Xanthobacter sp. TB0139]|uniref:TetR/AcrR family transcriptional regulator n=1 Tax=Xanthobacter sp. TB0139 TaxID=3459178 RepID=UPI004039C73B
MNILESARNVLLTEGYAGLTLRNIASVAGIRLSNLQYYYPSKDNLVEDLLTFIFSVYYHRYNQISLDKNLTPEEKLTALTEYLLKDIRDKAVNKVFFELWTLSQHNSYVSEMLSDMYDNYCDLLDDLIANISPEMPAAKRKNRAILAAFLIEGIMVHININQASDKDLSAIDKECVELVQYLAH